MRPSAFHRREFLKASTLTAAGMALSPFLSRSLWAADSGAPKNILFFTKSAGFQHSVVKRDEKDPTKLAYAEQIPTDVGAKHGFTVTCSKDGSLFQNPETIAKYDAFAFYTTGDLTKDSDK